MAYHAFVVMPFGVKEGIDFNRVYEDYVKPALEAADFEVFRADEELQAGDIRTDMFQELLLADLVVADLSIDNPNVWYELGVRHALRRRGVIQIACRRDHMPFDVYTDRSLKYHIKENPPEATVPHPTRLEEDKKRLAQFATETINSWYDRKVSPVYHLLRYLQEPDWKSLRVEEAREFWEEYESWIVRIQVARKRNLPGDVLVLADEAPTRVFRVEAFQAAGKALLSLGQYQFALAQYERALAIKPQDLENRRQKGLLLGRLKRHDQAREWVEALVQDCPGDAESWALLGRIEKDNWAELWRMEGKAPDAMRKDAADEEGLLREAINAYATGYRKDPSHFYSGINAVTLLYLQTHLTGNEERLAVRKEMEGGVRWDVRGTLEKDPKDYWARVTLAELEVLSGPKNIVQDAYRSAVAVADKDWFKLTSSRQQLELLQAVGFRPEEVKCGLEILDRALSRIKAPEKAWTPRQVFLFSGHMIDAPDRPEPRFPPDKEPIAAQAIAAKLDELEAGSEDIALCGGACGGDLLFAEACLARGMRVELRLAFDEPTFIQRSVAFAGDHWIERFYRVKGQPKTAVFIMPDEIGPAPKGVNEFSRTNIWQLYTALAWGPEKVRFVCLWNRKGGDGPGGTEHMYETVQKYAGRVYVLDTTSLW
ncbi:MAG TPA: TRAFs-binding domain-containing protein [Candidatus Binatia bacterium]|jgi:tetratricopeptide (TPR) repeat protein